MRIVSQSESFSHTSSPAVLLLAPPTIAGLLPASIAHRQPTPPPLITLSVQVSVSADHADVLLMALQKLAEASATYLLGEREPAQPAALRNAAVAFLERIEKALPQPIIEVADPDSERAKEEASAAFQLAKARYHFKTIEEMDAELQPIADKVVRSFNTLAALERLKQQRRQAGKQAD